MNYGRMETATVYLKMANRFLVEAYDTIGDIQKRKQKGELIEICKTELTTATENIEELRQALETLKVKK